MFPGDNRLGDIINKYELIAPFQNKDAGFSRWTFAKKNGKIFFIKEFLNPIFPFDDDLDEKIKSDMLAVCNTYENKTKKLYQALNNTSDGNLVRIQDFFRVDSHYYITTEKINDDKIGLNEVAKLSYDDKLLLCRSMAHSLMKLERAHIVHADLKANNIILHRTRNNKIIGKIIDFDCSFFEDAPPENEDDLGCDQVYISPEALQFICGDEVSLTCKMDVFALGILFHQYYTGELPGYDTNEYGFLADALLDGADISVSPSVPKEIAVLIKKMLDCNPEKRPTMSGVYNYLGKVMKIEPAEKKEKKAAAKNYFYKAGSLDDLDNSSNDNKSDDANNTSYDTYDNSYGSTNDNTSYDTFDNSYGGTSDNTSYDTYDNSYYGTYDNTSVGTYDNSYDDAYDSSYERAYYNSYNSMNDNSFNDTYDNSYNNSYDNSKMKKCIICGNIYNANEPFCDVCGRVNE